MFKKLVGFAIATMVLAMPAFAQPVTLKFNSPAPPPSILHSQVFEPWIAKVEEASEGTLKIQLFVGGTLGNFQVNYDRVVDGVADIGFILTSFAGGQFKKLDVAELPFQSKNSTEAAYALWELYASGLVDDEFDKVKPLAIWTFPNAALHTKTKITSVDDLQGMKLVTSNVATSKIVEQLGGVPVTFTPPDAYQAIARGIANGTLMPFTGMRIFKIHEVTDHHLNEPLGAATALMFINKQKYDSLPDKAKAAIDEFSYMELSQLTGKAVDQDWANSVALVEDSTNVLSPEQEEKWKELTQPIADEWASNTPNGKAILEAFQEGIQEFRSRQETAK